MRAVVVYESMYGNTHAIAEAIGSGIAHSLEVSVVPVREADAALVGDVDLLVVGGPTHVHGMSRPSTREAAVEAAGKADGGLTMEPEAREVGVREWLESVGKLQVRAAAFDTRVDMPAVFTGRASKGIAHKLHQLGCSLVADPESFLVTKATELEPDEEAHARRWGAILATELTARARTGTP